MNIGPLLAQWQRTGADSKPDGVMTDLVSLEGPGSRYHAGVEHAASPDEYPRRSLILFAIGALVGLALAGYGLFTAQGSKAGHIPDGAIALVNNRVILLSDYKTQLEALYEVPLEKATAEQRKAVLENMISEELQVQRGLEVDLAASDQGVREALVAGVQRTSTADVEAKKPADDELRSYFAKHPDKFRSTGMMALRNLVAPADAPRAAEQAVQALRSGMPADAAMKRFGLKPSAPEGGAEEPDIALKRTLGEKLFAAAEGLSAGQVSDPIAGPDGIHILVMAARRPSVPLEFDAARERIAADMKRERQQQAREEYVRFLRGKAEILLAPGYGP